MIGFFGIIANERKLKRSEREEAFSRMMYGVDTIDFNCTFVDGGKFSIGLTRRNIGDNKDLAIKLIRADFAIAFTGYGKLRGDKRLCWAEEMIDRVVALYQDQGQEVLTQIEGSFDCLIVEDRQFFIVSDRFSSKNLFYHQGEKVFVFAPDVGRVIESGLVPRGKNLDAARQVLVSGFFLDDSTLASDVFRFPYGSVFEGVVAPSMKVGRKRYWDVRREEGSVDEITPDLVSEFRDKIKRAIYGLSDLEERAVVPLSGGLDSRAIACYVAKRQPLNTLTYDLGDEVSISKKVCRALNGRRTYLSNKFIKHRDFKIALERLVNEQRIHAVLNQYFYAPLFREYFNENREKLALYDGVYMDILFSAPYTYPRFEGDDFIGVYGKGASLVGLFSKKLNSVDLLSLLKQKNIGIQTDLESSDGVARSQKAYISGRLRRYVLESLSFKEDYSYVFKPGFDYELVDFGYSLSLRLRKGLLYQELFKAFPGVTNIQYKDSYGNRPERLAEKVKDQYESFRLKLSHGTNGLLPYFHYQTEWFFLGQKEIDNYKEIFMRRNCIEEFFEEAELEKLFEKVKKKHYLFNLFQRVLFLQQFYRRYGF